MYICKKTLFVYLSLCFLSACTSMPKNTMINMSETASRTAKVVTTQDAPKNVESLRDTSSLGDAALTPLEDINIRKAEIPSVLLNMESPYQAPLKMSCEGLIKEVKEYDALLGADFDEEATINRTNEVKALNAASSLVGGLIPFRGLVRTASGAASYDKEVERAYRKGVARRGFLKGLMASRACNSF